MIQIQNQNLRKSCERLSQRTVKGSLWVFLLRIVQELFSLVRTVILARILSPQDFGLLGIALLIMAILETFSQTGFKDALIQKKENINTHLNAVWTVLIIRGFILFTIIYLIAPFASVLFNAPEAKLIIRFIGFTVLFQSFTNIGVIYFQKELEFNKEFMYQFVGTLADFIVAVSVVLILRNVWALVLGLLAGSAVRCFLSYLIHPYRPRLSYNLGKTRELFKFGKWIFSSSILIFLVTQGDDIFVGKFLGVIMLGFYQMAYKISNIPATEITHMISQVTFPAYSKLQDEMPKLREAYLKVLQITAFLSFPISGLIFVLAPDFTRIFLGEKWMPMVPAMKALVLWGLIRSIGGTTGPIFQAIGRPEKITKYLLVQLVMLIILIYPTTMYWGIFGTSFAVLFSSIGANALAFYAAIKITNCGIYNFLRFISFPLISTLLAIVPIFILKVFWVTPNISLTIFILSILSYGLVYFGVMYIFDKFSTYKILYLVKDIFLDVRIIK